MKVSDLLLHIIALSAFLLRVNYLLKAIKRNEKGKIKWEILIITLIIAIWAFLVWGLPYLFD